jgi:hypothetical protein
MKGQRIRTGKAQVQEHRGQFQEDKGKGKLRRTPHARRMGEDGLFKLAAAARGERMWKESKEEQGGVGVMGWRGGSEEVSVQEGRARRRLCTQQRVLLGQRWAGSENWLALVYQSAC